MKFNNVLRYLLVFLLVFANLGSPLSEAAVKESKTFPNYSDFGISSNNKISNLNKDSYPDKSLFDNVNLNGNKDVVVNGLAYFDNGFGINGTSNFDIKGDAYFKGAINVNGTKDIIEIGGNAHVNQSINMSGNTSVVIEKDLYVYGNPNFVFNGAKSTICVKGDLHYTNTPPQYKITPCGSEGQGLYVEGGQTGEPVSLDFEVTPSQDGGNIIDQETGVAIADINASIIPKGQIGNVEATRQTPIDVVFIFDTSGSMVLDMSSYHRGNYNSDPQKFSKAKDAATNAVEKFKESAINGDRFALVPFSSELGTIKTFNTDTSKNGAVNQLNSIKESINSLKANGGTNYYAALSKANQLFGNSTNPKYVIFLTDGRPDTYEDYPRVQINGEYNKKLYEKECFLIFCSKKSRGWSTEKYPVNATNISIRTEDNEAVFEYNREKYLYSDYADGDKDYAYAILAASNLASKGAKLLSIGFGSENDVDMTFLNHLSSLTGSFAQLGDKADISSIFENLTNMINKQAIRNIKVKVKRNDPSFPGNVSLEEGAVVDVTNPDYAVINFEDIQYEPGKTPNPPGQKTFSLTFDKPGSYTFTDIYLTYTDFSNKTITVPGEQFTIKVFENKSIGLKFNANKYEIDVDSNPVPTLNLLNEISPKNEGSELPDKVSWTSENPAIAKVSEDGGIVIPVSVGETKITVNALDEKGIPLIDEETGKEMKAEATIVVNVVVDGIAFKQESYLYTGTIDMFQQINVKQSAPPQFKLNRGAVDIRTDGNIFKEENGYISRNGEAAGFQIITAELKNPDLTKKYYYKVNPSSREEDKVTTALMKVSNNPKTIDEPKEQW